MNREEWYKSKWAYLKRFAWMGLIGFIFIIVFAVTQVEIFGIGIFLVLPLFFWLVLMPLLHWKDRYIGRKSTLWGALLLLETSGWFKIIYWFRHILPDWKRSGRYAESE